MKDGKRTSIVLDPLLDARLEELAEITGESKAVMIRQVLRSGIGALAEQWSIPVSWRPEKSGGSES